MNMLYYVATVRPNVFVEEHSVKAVERTLRPIVPNVDTDF